MQVVKVVPENITETLQGLRRFKYADGREIALEHLRWTPPDFMKPLHEAYRQEFGWKYRTVVIPKMLAIMYRVILTIPELSHLYAVVHNDNGFANKALGFPSTYVYSHKQGCNRNHPYVGKQGLQSLYNEMLVVESQGKHLSTAFHNLSDELDYKKITFEGLVPPVWVEYYRKPRLHLPVHKPINNDAFAAICSNNTGIDIIDDVSRNIPLDIRSDIRQDAALHCLAIGLDKLTNDQVANIVNSVYKKYRNKEIAKSFEERSLFSQPYGDGREMWQVLASTT